MKLFEELKWRGLIQDISSPELEEKLNNGGMTFYIGTDPTADSLHIGHYSSFLITKRLADAGHNPIILVGGATGLIGDPRGTGERDLADKEIIARNFEGLKTQVQKLFPYKVVNNFDWVKDLTVIDFLRDYGKYINVNYMLNKDLVRRQMETGISYAEFSYMLIQGLDFKYLHENMGVDMQVAGSDQWGNITTGIELIRKTTGDEVFAFTMPLITKADGTKFGKSGTGNVWLDKSKTTPYQMYQFFINSEDSMVIKYLKMLTLLSKEEIEELEKLHLEAPEKREAHKALAREVITFIHGKEEYENALKISEALFTEKIKELSADEILNNFQDVPNSEIIEDTNIIDLLVNNKICSSKREAREMVLGNAISINNQKYQDLELTITKELAIDGKVLLVKKGKKNYYVVKYI